MGKIMIELFAEIAKAIVSIWIPLVAMLALTTWRKQSKAKIQIDFMTELTDSVHEFIYLMAAPIATVRHVKIGMESYSELPALDKTVKNPGVVAYIQHRGKEDAKRLYERLKPCTEHMPKIKSLLTKGQVFGLKNYNKCWNACNMILWQYERIQTLCFMIEDGSLNWKHPEVEKTLAGAIALKSEDINRDIEVHNVEFLAFVRDNYKKIYK